MHKKDMHFEMPNIVHVEGAQIFSEDYFQVTTSLKDSL